MYLQVDKLHPCLGIPPSPWDDKLYAQKGEFYRNQAVLVEWKSHYFHQINQQVIVPMSDTIDATLAGDPTLKLLGLYTQGGAGTELIKLHALTPCEARERVSDQLVMMEWKLHAKPW